MSPRVMHSVAAFASLLASPAFAVPWDVIQPGQVFYVQQVFGNELVQVVALHPGSNLVEVVRQDGTTDWVAPDRLLTADQSTVDEYAEGAGWVIVGGAVLCAMFEECRDAVAPPE